jgi:L-lactate utilization protein LutC
MPTVPTDSKFAQVASDQEIEKAKTALEANGFKVKIVENLAAARAEVESIIPAKAEVFTATSVTLDEAGLTDVLNSDKYTSVRNKFMSLYGDASKAVEMRRIGSGADYAVGSVHAVTEDGQVVVASATGSQFPNYAYGASNVIWVVGAQKIVPNLTEALDRIENYTFRLEDARALKAYGANSSLNKILIYRKETAGRVTIILVKEAVGF